MRGKNGRTSKLVASEWKTFPICSSVSHLQTRPQLLNSCLSIRSTSPLVWHPIDNVVWIPFKVFQYSCHLFFLSNKTYPNLPSNICRFAPFFCVAWTVFIEHWPNCVPRVLSTSHRKRRNPWKIGRWFLHISSSFVIFLPSVKEVATNKVYLAGRTKGNSFICKRSAFKDW